MLIDVRVFLFILLIVVPILIGYLVVKWARKSTGYEDALRELHELDNNTDT